MGTFLQDYGAEEERRGRVIKWIVIACVAVFIVAIAAYFIFHNYPEKQKVKHFLAQLNSHDYQAAYRDWGCTAGHPCPNYDYHRFLDDWGPKVSAPWKIASIDGCKTFVTVNVQADGAELQSLAVQRNNDTLSYAPAPECQEPQWHWKQFFQRIFHRGS